MAVDDLKGFTSPDFHEDYQGIAFDIEAGCVMAVGKMVTVDISKDIDDLANTPSIFNISKNPDESCKQMLVDMSQRKIIIKLPLSDFYSYKALSATPLAQPILISLTVVPALVYVLEELRALPIQERSENSDTLWYKVLSKALLTQFDCDIESEEFNNQNCLVLAQKLINNPVTDAMFATCTGSAKHGVVATCPSEHSPPIVREKQRLFLSDCPLQICGFSAGTGDAPGSVSANALPCLPSTGACHAPVIAPKEK